MERARWASVGEAGGVAAGMATSMRAMPIGEKRRQYRVLFVDLSGEVFGDDTIIADDDDSAIARAKKVLRMGIGDAFELWRGDTLIYSGKLLNK